MSEKIEQAHIFRKIIGTSLLKVLPKNANRTNLKIYNNSSNILYICTKPTDTVNDGYPVAASGEYSNEHFQGELYLIADGASSNIRIEEDAC